MKFVVLKFLFLIGIYCLSVSEVYDIESRTRRVKKEEKIKEKKPNCCLVDKQIGKTISLEKVCVERDRTEFHFRCLISHGICVYPERLKMSDSDSNQYKLYGTNRILQCPKLIKAPEGYSFQWYFEALKGEPQFVNVSEDVGLDYLEKDFKSPVEKDWVWWHWEKINLSQCRPKR